MVAESYGFDSTDAYVRFICVIRKIIILLQQVKMLEFISNPWVYDQLEDLIERKLGN